MKTVYRCVWQEDALVVSSMLDSAGIANAQLCGSKLDVTPCFDTAIEGFTIVVPDDDEEEALAIVAAYRATGDAGPKDEP